VDVVHDVRVVLRADLDARDPEVPAHLEDFLRAAPGGGRHPEDEPAPHLLVRVRHVDVRVVPDGPVGLVEHDQRDIVEPIPLRAKVVLHHLGGRGDDLRLPPQEHPLVRRSDLAREHGYAVRVHD